MLRNFIKTAYRNLMRNKSYTFLNVFGLSIGIGCSIVIYNIISYEMSFDKHQSNYDKIYRVYREGKTNSGAFKEAGQPYTLSDALREDYPGIKAAMLEDYGSSTFILQNSTLRKDKISIDHVAFLESGMLEIIDVNFLFGKGTDLLGDKGALILSVSAAKKIFGLNEMNLSEAVGEIVNFENKTNLIVRGIYEDLPKNSEFYFDTMISYATLSSMSKYFDMKRWGIVNSNNFCYVLTDKAGKVELETKFKSLNDKYYGDRGGHTVDFKLQTLSDIHLNEDFQNISESVLDKQSMMILIGIVLILILTSCLNFVNLSTALVIVRAKEIGIRKTIGSSRTLLIVQFITETLLIVFLSLILGLGIAELLNYNLDTLIGKAVHLNVFNNIGLLPYLGVLLLVIVLLSGMYPAYILSKINPSVVLKTSLSSGNSKGINVRRGLVIMQLLIAQLLIIGTLVLHFQMKHFYNKDLGFEKDGIINVNIPRTNQSIEKAKRLQTILNNRPEIISTSLNISSPKGRSNRTNSISYKSIFDENNTTANFKFIDENYLDLFDIELLSGRNVRKNDGEENVIINEKLMHKMEFIDVNDVLGEKIQAGDNKTFTVIGVVQDFHVYSLYSDIPLTMMMNSDKSKGNLAIKISKNTEFQGLLSSIEDEWTKIFPDNFYQYSFFDEQLKSSYRRTEKINILVKTFAVITILISCLGLYGLIAFVANQKTKEIGIRKVLGATMINILNIFSKEIIYMAIVAFVIAAPLGYYLLDSFLDDFHFRIEIGPMFFMSSLLLTLLISLITVAYKTYFTAIQNPVLSLKDE